MNTIMNSNPGVGLQMTTSRQSIYDRTFSHLSDTPSPQSYNVEFKLTDREKRQNELISRRYDYWKKQEYHVNKMKKNGIADGRGESTHYGICDLGTTIHLDVKEYLCNVSYKKK